MNEALIAGEGAAGSIEAFYYRTGLVPPNLEAAGYAGAASPLVRGVTMTEQGIVRVELAFSPVDGKAFLLVPSLDANKKIAWKCAPGDVEPKYLPARCRQSNP